MFEPISFLTVSNAVVSAAAGFSFIAVWLEITLAAVLTATAWASLKQC